VDGVPGECAGVPTAAVAPPDDDELAVSLGGERVCEIDAR